LDVTREFRGLPVHGDEINLQRRHKKAVYYIGQ
jgi:hypothetical protein